MSVFLIVDKILRLLTPALSSFGKERENLFYFVNPGRRSFFTLLAPGYFLSPVPGFFASGYWEINLPGARHWGPSSPKAISPAVQASQFQRTAVGN